MIQGLFSPGSLVATVSSRDQFVWVCVNAECAILLILTWHLCRLIGNTNKI